MSMSRIKVPNKSLSHELNNVLLNGLADRYSNGIQILDHFASNLLLTIQIPNYFGFKIPTVFTLILQVCSTKLLFFVRLMPWLAFNVVILFLRMIFKYQINLFFWNVTRLSLVDDLTQKKSETHWIRTVSVLQWRSSVKVALNSAPAYFTTQLLLQHQQLLDLEKFTETKKNGRQFKIERVKYKKESIS